MADTKHKLKKYKQYLESNPDGDKVLSVLNKLDALPVSISLLQDTGIGKLVNGFRKKPDGIGTIAKSIVNKWKNLVAEEAKKATKLDSDDEQEYVPEPPKNVKYEASYNPTSKSQSEDEYCPKHVAEEYTPEDVKYKPNHREVNKYAKYSNEKYKPKHTSPHSSSKEKYVPTKISSPDNSENETYSPSRMNDDPLPYSPQHMSDNSEEEAYDQATPEQNDSEADTYDPTNNKASPSAGASYTPTPKYESEQKHKSSSAKSDKHSSKSAKSSHSEGHKSRNGSLHSSSKNEGSHSSSKTEKHSSNGEKHSSKHKSHDEKHSKSDKHSSKHSDNEKHSKSQNGSHSSKSKDNVSNGKHPSSSSSHNSKDKKPSSSSVKASGSSEKKSGDRSSSSKSSEKHSNHSERKSDNSVIPESPSKLKLDKNRNEKRKISKIQPIDDSFDLFSPDDGAVVKRVKVESKPKVDSSSKSSKDSHKHSKHHSSSSSSSKPKDDRPDKKDSTSKSTKHGEERLEKRDKHSKSKSSSSSKGEKRKVKEESLADDATDGFSFDDFLNCDVKVPKKKLKKDLESSASPWSSSLKISKPSTSKMATKVTDNCGFVVPKPSKQKFEIHESDILSLLPETSATYRPLPTRSSEDDRKHSLATFDPMVIGTKQGKRTQVYSGRKHGLSEMKSLFSQCIQVLMDNIDAIDYVGGVPYDILKPVLERCSVTQLLRLEDLNPHFVGEDEEVWAVHCEKEFKNQEPDEMESWRELYLRLVEERETRLEKLRMNMNKLQASKPKSRQVQLAYVDAYVKPPREVLRKQQRYGTGKVVSASNSIQSTSKGGRANFSHHISVPQPKAVKPVAPMMQKINKMLSKRRK